MYIDKFLLYLRKLGFEVGNQINEPESSEYFACSFSLDGINVKFRKAKVTPKKVGQFVTLWKRNDQNITVPFDEHDVYDFYIIAIEEEHNSGYFVFTKEVLVEKGILSKNLKGGKRGFRVYPSWVKTSSKQAEKTQIWQSKYFINLNESDKFKQILHPLT